MIGEFLNDMFNEVTGKDPATKRAATSPLRVFNTNATLGGYNSIQQTVAAGMDMSF